MGKHDKEIQVDWNEDAGESYIAAENQKLKAENAMLKVRLDKLEGKYAKACKAYCGLKELARENVIDANKTIESKDRVIEKLERKILSLVNDYV